MEYTLTARDPESHSHTEIKVSISFSVKEIEDTEKKVLFAQCAFKLPDEESPLCFRAPGVSFFEERALPKEMNRLLMMSAFSEEIRRATSIIRSFCKASAEEGQTFEKYLMNAPSDSLVRNYRFRLKQVSEHDLNVMLSKVREKFFQTAYSD